MIPVERVGTAHAPYEAVVDSTRVGSGLVFAASAVAAAAAAAAAVAAAAAAAAAVAAAVGKAVAGCTQVADTHAEAQLVEVEPVVAEVTAVGIRRRSGLVRRLGRSLSAKVAPIADAVAVAVAAANKHSFGVVGPVAQR